MGVRIMGAVGSALKVDTARRDLRDQMDPGRAARAMIAPQAPPLQLAAGSASRAIRIVRAVCGALQVDTARRDLRDQMDPGSAARAIIALKAPPLIRAAGSAVRAIIAPQAPPLNRAAGSAGRAIIAP
jgi:hypothetical protein